MMTLRSYWKKSLKTILANRASQTTPSRVAILGIGNEQNGDDAAGVLLARGLAGLTGQPHLLVLEAGLAPENFTGPLRRFGPDYVLLVDAADMGDVPGMIRMLDWRDSTGFGPSTHLQPPSTFAEYLIAETGCEVVLLGIQPARLDFDTGLSAPVKKAVSRLRRGLRELLSQAQRQGL